MGCCPLSCVAQLDVRPQCDLHLKGGVAYCRTIPLRHILRFNPPHWRGLIPSPGLRKISPLLQFALRSTPCSLISLPSPIARLCPVEITFNYSCLFSTNTSEMELANKQWQTTLILVYNGDPLMHWRSGRLLTGTCYCLRLLPSSDVDTVNMFTGAMQP